MQHFTVRVLCREQRTVQARKYDEYSRVRRNTAKFYLNRLQRERCSKPTYSESSSKIAARTSNPYNPGSALSTSISKLHRGSEKRNKGLPSLREYEREQIKKNKEVLERRKVVSHDGYTFKEITKRHWKRPRKVRRRQRFRDRSARGNLFRQNAPSAT